MVMLEFSLNQKELQNSISLALIAETVMSPTFLLQSGFL